MGLAVEILDNEPYFFYTEKENEGMTTSVVLVHFLAKKVGEIAPGEDITEWRWIDMNTLDQEVLAPNIKPTLKHFGS